VVDLLGSCDAVSLLYRTQIESGKLVKLVWLPHKLAVGEMVKLRGSARQWFVTYQWAKGGKGNGGSQATEQCDGKAGS
jgi:hypothetical protein